MNREKFKKEIEEVINRNCAENGSDTPDFILAEYLVGCLENYNKATIERSEFYTELKSKPPLSCPGNRREPEKLITERTTGTPPNPIYPSTC